MTSEEVFEMEERRLSNKAMERKLRDGEAIDVSKCVRRADGCYELERFVGEVDYCDSEREAWIWSIGKDAAGRYFAACDARFYQNPDFKCVWLR